MLHENVERRAVLEFTRDRKTMSVLINQNNQNKMCIKGAPDYLIQKAKSIMTKSGEIVPFTNEAKESIMNHYQSFARKGLRCLAVGMKYDLGVL